MKFTIFALCALASFLEMAVASGQTASPQPSADKTAPAKKSGAKKAAARQVTGAGAPAAPAKAAPPPGAAAKKPATAQRAASKSASAAKKPAAKKRVYKPAPPVDPTLGDVVDGEDLTVRRAAVDALGAINGAVVAVDPTDGRVLSIVNQKLALKSGFTPCSTIKLVTALAALSEGIIERDTPVRLSRTLSFNLTTALAYSNNLFFQRLGNQLGYDRVTRYARMLGLGEKAGLDIPGEEAGVWPDSAPKGGGVGMMTAYGENILMTPLELAALLSAIANGGDLYYLQYPGSLEQAEQIEPKLKRRLELAPDGISDIKAGMRAAVDVGTARRAGYNSDEPILGKTGTCTDFREASHLGWFGSFNEVEYHRLVIVVVLLGTKSVSGPVASGVAGAIYRNLSEQRYFASQSRPEAASDSDLLSTGVCCSR
jgi:cell division protein FtsI/penicillin-binding protein 2